MTVGPAGKEPSQISGGEAKASNLEVSYAVYNSKTKKWETPKLNPEEIKQIQRAVENIKWTGQKDKSGAFQSFDSEGTVIEISGDRILVQKGGRWVDLIKEKSLSKEARRNLRQITSSMKIALGQIGEEGREKERAAIDQGRLKALRSKNPVIEVRVAPTTDKYAQRYAEEEKFYEQVISANYYFDDLIQGFENSGVNFSQIDLTLAKQSLEALQNAAYEVISLMAGEVDEYIAEMPTAFGAYCDALREWSSYQQSFEHVLGTDPESNPFRFDTSRPIFHEAVFKEAVGLASDPSTAQALQKIEATNQSYQNFIRLRNLATKQITELEVDERAFNAEIQKAIVDLSRRDEEGLKLQAWLVEHNVDIGGYLKQLQNLKIASDRVLEVIDDTVAYISAGMIKEGIDHYMAEFDPQTYESALTELITPQRVALGQLPDPLTPFTLNLDRIRQHEIFLKGVSNLSADHPVLDKNGAKVIDESSWIVTTNLISSIEERHRTESLEPPFFKHMNAIHRQYRNMADGVGSFLDLFSEHRELFEEIMRAGGFSNLETAYLYNHFDRVHAALNSWNVRFQEVVDLANVKEFREAMNIFSQIVKTEYPKITTAMESLTLIMDQIQGTTERGLLKQFLVALRIDEGKRSTITSALERMIGYSSHIQLNFNEAVKLLFNLERPSLEFPKDWDEMATPEFPQVWIDARGVIKENMLLLNSYQSEEIDLYRQSSRFADFFKIDDPKWKAFFKEKGWTSAQVNGFTRIFNEFAREIEPLRKGEIAYFNEHDPEKQRALGLQLRKLAAERHPEIERLRLQFKQLGGIERLNALPSLIEEFYKMNIGDAKDELETKYYENEPALQSFLSITSPEELMSLEEKLSKLPSEIRRGLDFSPELDLIHEIEKVEEAHALVNLFNERSAFMNRIYEDLNLFRPASYGIVQRSLLTGPHSTDSRWKGTLKARGWSDQKIKKFSRLYDQFQRDYEVLDLAKKRLDEDPDSVILQKEFEEFKKTQIPKLHQFTQDLKKLGGRNAIDDLGFAIGNYMVTLEKYPLSAPDRDKSKQMLQELVNLKTNLIGMSEWIDQMDKLPALSWNKGYLKPLSEALTPTEFKEIQSLYRDYQTLLKKVQLLERKLEADPGNRNLRNALHQELQTKESRYFDLEKRLEALQPRLPLLQAKIDKYYGEEEAPINLEHAFFMLSNVYRSASRY